MAARTRSGGRRVPRRTKAIIRPILPSKLPWETRLNVIEHAVTNTDGILVARGYPEKVGLAQGRGIKRTMKSLLAPFSQHLPALIEAKKAFWPQNEVVFPASTEIHTLAAEACWDEQLLEYEPNLQHVHFLVRVNSRTNTQYPAAPAPWRPGNPHRGHIDHAYRMINYALQNCRSLKTLTIQFRYDAVITHSLLYPSNHTQVLNQKLVDWFTYIRQKKTVMGIDNVILAVAPGDRVARKAEQSHPITLAEHEIAEQGKGDLVGVGDAGVCAWITDRFFNFAGDGMACRVAVRLA